MSERVSPEKPDKHEEVNQPGRAGDEQRDRGCSWILVKMPDGSTKALPILPWYEDSAGCWKAYGGDFKREACG